VGGGNGSITYIWVVSDLLDEILIEVARVTLEVISDTIFVFDTLKDVARYWELAALSKLSSLVLGLEMDLLNPGLVDSGRGIVNVLLKDDNVVIWDLNGVLG